MVCCSIEDIALQRCVQALTACRSANDLESALLSSLKNHPEPASMQIPRCREVLCVALGLVRCWCLR